MDHYKALLEAPNVVDVAAGAVAYGIALRNMLAQLEKKKNECEAKLQIEVTNSAELLRKNKQLEASFGQQRNNNILIDKELQATRQKLDEVRTELAGTTMCQICLEPSIDGRKNAALSCGHLCCMGCALRCINGNKKCYVCRQRVGGFSTVYL